MSFVVFEDFDDATETKIHRESCRHYLNRKLDASTVRWHGPFERLKDAEEHAESVATSKRHGVKAKPSCCW